MKKLIISVVSTVMMIGAGAAFRSNQDISVPTVEKSSQETVSVEKKKTQLIKVIQKKRAFLLAQKNKILKVMIVQRVV